MRKTITYKNLNHHTICASLEHSTDTHSPDSPWHKCPVQIWSRRNSIPRWDKEKKPAEDHFGGHYRRVPQARMLEWVAISFFRESSWLGSNSYLLHLLHWQADPLPPSHPGSPKKKSGQHKWMRRLALQFLHLFINGKNDIYCTRLLCT